MGATFETIAKAEQAGNVVDHTIVLRDAKRRVRKEAEWSDPFSWAPFTSSGTVITYRWTGASDLF